MLHIRATPTIILNRRATKEAQHYLQPQAHTHLPNYMYSKGSQMRQHKKGVIIHSNNKRVQNNQDRFTHYKVIHISNMHPNIMYSHLTHIMVKHTQIIQYYSLLHKHFIIM